MDEIKEMSHCCGAGFLCGADNVLKCEECKKPCSKAYKMRDGMLNYDEYKFNIDSNCEPSTSALLNAWFGR